MVELGQAERALHHYQLAYEALQPRCAIRPASLRARVDLANAQVDLSRIDPAIR